MRAISEGSWAWVKLPGRRKYKAKIRVLRADGADVTDPKNGALRTVRFDYLTPANKPRA